MHRSVSQVKQLKECPYRYKLSRIDRVWQRPAAWLPHGTAVHETAEAWERSGRSMTREETHEVFSRAYSKATGRLCEQTPNFDWWSSSGRYRGEQDVERRYQIGLDHVDRYVSYYADQAPNEVIWITPEGEPAIELAFDLDLDGVQVKGYIDQVIEMPSGEIRVRDIKTGASPGDDFQLATYKLAVEQLGPVVRHGDYWMAKAGKPTVPYELGEWSKERLTDIYGEADQAILNERFDPDPDPAKCRRCPVNLSCDYSA